MADNAKSTGNPTRIFPFSNRGVVQKLDVNQLEDNQYPFLLNMICQQEGAIKPRLGWKKLNTTWTGGQPSYAHTMAVSRNDPKSNLTVYLGEGVNIRRNIYNGDTSISSDTIGTNVSLTPTRGTYPVWKFNSSGESYMAYFATGYTGLRDNGAYTEARTWGIDAPTDYARCAPGGYTFKNLITDGTFSTAPAVSLTNARLNDTVASVTQIVANSGADGYYAITPAGGSASINTILPGMYLKVGAQNIFVDKVDAPAGKFYAYFTSLPAAGNTIQAYQSGDITGVGVVTDSISISSAGGLPADLSFGGSAENGFETDDQIHISLYVTTPATISDIRLRLQAGDSANDFYEKSILPSPAQDVIEASNVITDNVNAENALNEYGRLQSTNVYGQIDDNRIQDGLTINPYIPPPDNINSGLQPSSTAPATSGTWNEISISKKDFLKVGRAGQSGFTWANITAVELVVKPHSTADTQTVKLGSIFAYGGAGLNSDRSEALQPYDYIFTYMDSSTRAEGNPSQLMIPASYVRVGRQSIKIQVRGCDKTGANAGIDQIRIYRRGGAYTDGLFRLVGQIDNPGAGSTAVFEDSTEDISLIAAPFASFDNFPPVVSDLPFATDIQITAVSSLGDGKYAITVNTPPTLYGKVGTAFTISPRDDDSNTEIRSYIDSFVWPTFNAYCQRAPVVGEEVVITTVPRSISNIAGIFQDRIWITGSYNFSRLFSSKTSRPESFPIINEANGNSHVIDVSSPDDPINGLIEFGGELLVMCQNGLYTIRLDQGRILGPFKTPSSRGLFTRNAFCRVDNEIWFLAYDGIYAWNGGSLRKVSLEIDPLFQGETVNGIPPVDLYGNFGGLDAISFFSMETRNNEVLFSWMNTDGYFTGLRYHLIFQRWSLEEYYNPTSAVTIDRNGNTLKVCSITAMQQDKSTGEIVLAMSTTEGGGTYADVAFWDKLAKDKVDSGSGSPIYYQLNTKSFDMSLPMQQKQFTDIGLEVTIGSTSDTYHIEAYYDYSPTVDPFDSFDLSPTSTGRQILQFPLGQSGAPTSSFGHEARVSSWSLYGLSTSINTAWHNLSITYIDLADLQKGRIMDWSDLGHPWDKRMNTVTIEYDTGANEVDLYLDYIYSKDGDTTNLSAQTITLGSGVGTSRAKQTFAIVDGVVAKLVRLRPKVATAQYQIFGTPEWNFEKYPADIVNFTDYSDYGHPYEKRFYVLYINVDTNGQTVTLDIEGDGAVKQTVTVSGTAANRMISKAINVDIIAKLVRLKVTNIPTGGKFQLFDHKFEKENLPPEIVLSTEWDDFGYNFDKYFQQLTLDVNTNGQTVPVKVYGDGVLKQTVTVNTTQSTRNINITLNPSMTCNIMRLEVDPAAIPSGGRFQLWGYKPIFQPADKGAVGHTFDWSDNGHPYDKKFVEMTFEYETDSDNVQIGVDTLTGIDGTTETLNVKTFTITSPGRGKAVIPLVKNDGSEIIAKMVRVHSNGTNGSGSQLPSFKMWNIQFPGTIPYPADKMLFTDFTDNGWSCDKVFRGIGLEIDTGGVDCQIYLDVDSTTGAESWTINTTTSNRRVFLTPDISSEIIGKMFRIRLYPGTNGKSQLFGQPNWDLVNDACEFVFFDTFEQAFGSVGSTVLWQQWIDYKCAGYIRMKFYNEDGVLFYTKDLPPHAKRQPERFYPPSSYNGVHNKSRKRRITIEALDTSKPFKFYRDSTRSEIYNLSADQRAGFYQNIIWQNLKIQV